MKDLDLPPENLKAAGLNPKEIDLAKRLVGDMTEHWDPGEFKDTYHEDLMARIREKIKMGQTKEITKPEAEAKGAPRSAEVIDLAELLKQSLGKVPSERKPPARAEARARDEPKLRVVAGASPAAKRTQKAPPRPAARRKRA